jgi:8-oxo-dGTP diphosphatase
MKYQAITACVFLHKDGKLFLGKRSLNKKMFPGKFEIPGGHIEFGETIEEGLLREIKEELNIEINLGEIFNAFTYLEGGNKHVVEIDYFATMKDPNQSITFDAEDFSEYAWITEDEIEKFIGDNPEVAKLSKKGFKLLKSRNVQQL